MSLANIAQAGSQVKELYDMLQSQNGNQRWDALQKWLKQNPEWEERKDKFLSCTPDEGITALCEYLGVKPSLLPFIDSNGEIRLMVKSAIIQIQTLYKEREAVDQTAVTNGHKPKKKSFKRAKRQS